jgi:hypothetical protein
VVFEVFVFFTFSMRRGVDGVVWCDWWFEFGVFNLIVVVVVVHQKRCCAGL